MGSLHCLLFIIHFFSTQNSTVIIFPCSQICFSNVFMSVWHLCNGKPAYSTRSLHRDLLSIPDSFLQKERLISIKSPLILFPNFMWPKKKKWWWLLTSKFVFWKGLIFIHRGFAIETLSMCTRALLDLERWGPLKMHHTACVLMLWVY